MPISPQQYLHQLKAIFSEEGHPETAEGQARYMRNQFEFYGLKAPAWGGLSKVFFKEHGLFDGEDLATFVRLCFEDDYREIQYLGLQMLEKQIKKQASECINLLEELIRTKSWWDTVDWINKLVSIHFERYPELIPPTVDKWMASNNIWLQRVCLIFQLRYKEKTDEALLFSNIQQLAHSKEFFIQKGAGWALRQYSRTNPEAVINFINANQLAPLTKREGLKWLKKNGM